METLVANAIALNKQLKLATHKIKTPTQAGVEIQWWIVRGSETLDLGLESPAHQLSNDPITFVSVGWGKRETEPSTCGATDRRSASAALFGHLMKHWLNHYYRIRKDASETQIFKLF